MKPPMTSWRSALILAAALLLFIALALAEVMAGDSTTPWASHIQKVEDALAMKNVSAARQAWVGLYAVALRSQRWEGILEAGDLYLRIGEIAGARKDYEGEARRIYRIALVRARQQGSLEGVLSATEAFARLGDHEVADYCLRIAEGMAAQMRDQEISNRVSAFRAVSGP